MNSNISMRTVVNKFNSNIVGRAMAYVWRQQLHKIESKQFSASSLHHLPKKNRKNIKMKAMGEI